MFLDFFTKARIFRSVSVSVFILYMYVLKYKSLYLVHFVCIFIFTLLSLNSFFIQHVCTSLELLMTNEKAYWLQNVLMYNDIEIFTLNGSSTLLLNEYL